ncbi:cytochrome P450 [Streptomyces sulphureus]|uniref:cytochrome P450 n=1 Tax=Streptomyces sulphureus TaxID=47758 RepID=UPI0003628D05|nr:cytochrome P450 [Streptomyces sulphureus]
MTQQDAPAVPGAGPDDQAPLLLYGEEFTQDPAPLYARARETAPIVRARVHEDVEVSLVVRYHTALKVLHHPEMSKNSGPWFEARERQGLPMPPVLEMMRVRPNALYEDGEEHRRLSTAVRDSLGRLDPPILRRTARETADRLVDTFAERGEADLMGEYAGVLPLQMFFAMFGVPDDLGLRIQQLTATVFDGGPEAAQANVELSATWQELVARKRREPGEDVASWLLAHPSSNDDDSEIINQLLLVMGAGTEPEQNLIASTLLQLLSDDSSYGRLLSGSQRIAEALETTLLDYAPMANYATHYPVRDLEIDGILLPAWEPVMVSFGSCNQDEALRGDATGGTGDSGYRAHLAWSAGPHECPAWSVAMMMASVAVEVLLDRLPDIELATPRPQLSWRPGPYQRGLSALPVVFPPQPVRPQDATADPYGSAGGHAPWQPSTTATAPSTPQRTPSPYDSTRSEATSTARQQPSAPRGLRRVWNSLAEWWRGR